METGYKRASRKAVTILAESLGLSFYYTPKKGFFIYKDLTFSPLFACRGWQVEWINFEDMPDFIAEIESIAKVRKGVK